MKTVVQIFWVIVLWSLTLPLCAQEVFLGDTLVIRFDNWSGAGFAPESSTGRIDSRSWIVNGLSDGGMNFGDTKLGGDFGRGLSSGRVTTGGVYAFTPVAGVRLLGFQPTGTDLAPGSATLRVRFPNQVETTGLLIHYDLWIYNDQDRSTLIELEWSFDGVTFHPASGGATSTPASAEVGVQWRKQTVSGTIASNAIEADSFLYIRWNMRDGAGTGSRDEWGLEEIRICIDNDFIIGPPTPMVTLLKYDFDADTDTPSNKSIDQFDARFGLVGANRIGYSTGSPGRAANSNGWTQTNSAWYIKLSTVGFSNIAVQSKQYSSSSGPKIFSLEWSSDSLSWKFLSTFEVGGTFTNIQPDRGIPLPTGAENNPKLWLRWRLASGISVGGGNISTTGTSRIDEIAVTGIPTGPIPPLMTATQITISSNTIMGFVQLSSNGTSMVNNIQLSCSQVDGDSLFAQALPVVVRSTINFQTGQLPKPSSWDCVIIASSDAGTSTSDLYRLSIEPPPLPYAEKPTMQARNIRLVARTDTTLYLRWDRGDGEFNMLAVIPQNEEGCLTDTSVTYLSHPNLNHAVTTRNGCKIVWSGSGNQAVVIGLNPLQMEVYTVLEFNGEPGRENYLEANQERAEFQTRAEIPEPIANFRTLLVTEDWVMFTWSPPSKGSTKVFIADAVPSRSLVEDYLDGKTTSLTIFDPGCESDTCTIMRDVIAEKILFALNVNGPFGHQSAQQQPFAVWEPSWPDPKIGRLLAEWDFNSQSIMPSWSIWEHQKVKVAVRGARDRGYASGYKGMASYTDQWHEPDISKSWEITLTTHGLTSAIVEFRVISSSSGPARFRVVCDISGELFASAQHAMASTSWASSLQHKVDIPTDCLRQPKVRLLITPDGDIAMNGNSISRAGTSRIDDIRFFGIYPSDATPLLGEITLLSNLDAGIKLGGVWISAAGLIPTRQSLKIESPSQVVELFYPISGLIDSFELKNLDSAVKYSISHCGYLGYISDCSKPLWVMTPHRIPDAPSIISHNIIDPDAVELIGASNGYDIIALVSMVGSIEPVLSDSIGLEHQHLEVIKGTSRQAVNAPIQIGGLRPNATYRFWMISVSGPDSLVRYSKSPHSFIDIGIPRLVEPILPEFTISTSERDFQSVRLSVKQLYESKLLFTVSPYEAMPSPPIDDEIYSHGRTYNTGDRIGTQTYVVGDIHHEILQINELPLGKKWRLRVYAMNALHGSVTYSKIYFEHIFETLPDPVAHPMTIETIWLTTVGDTVFTAGRVLWKNTEQLLLHIDGGNLIVIHEGGVNTNWDVHHRLALLGVKRLGGVQLITHIHLGYDGVGVTKPLHLHPDTSNAVAMMHSQVIIGNIMETDQMCDDGRTMYRQRGLNTRKVCLVGSNLPPNKGSFVHEWSFTGFPLYEKENSFLRVLVDSDKDITVYDPPRTVLYSPNKEQIILWTTASDTEIEFKWDYLKAIRPFDHFPDSVAADAYFITRLPSGRIITDRKLEGEIKSLTLKAIDLHRLHTNSDSLRLSIDLEWSVAMFHKMDSGGRELGSLEWIPFQLLRLKALYDTDVMDIPLAFKMDPARPNPFNPSTTLRFYIPETHDLNIQMYDILGRSVKTIRSGQIRAGVHDLNIEAGRLSSGVYIVRARYRDIITSQTITLVK